MVVCDCRPLAGECRDDGFCVCWPGISGSKCEISETRPFWKYFHGIMSVSLFFLLLFGVWVMLTRMNPAKLSRARLVATANVAIACGFIYEFSTLVTENWWGESGSPQWVVSYWFGGIFYFISFITHIQSVAFYASMIHTRFLNNMRGYVRMTQLPIIFAIVVVFFCEFVACCMYTTLVVFKVIPKLYDDYKFGYLTRQLVRYGSYALFSTTMIVTMSLYFRRMWLTTRSFILPAPVRKGKGLGLDFVSRDYVHPGVEVSARTLRRIKRFMVMFMVCDILFCLFSWTGFFVIAAKGRNDWYNLSTIVLREITLTIQLTGTIWTFGNDESKLETDISDDPTFFSRKKLLGPSVQTADHDEPPKRHRGRRRSSSLSRVEDRADDDEDRLPPPLGSVGAGVGVGGGAAGERAGYTHPTAASDYDDPARDGSGGGGGGLTSPTGKNSLISPTGRGGLTSPTGKSNLVSPTGRSSKQGRGGGAGDSSTGLKPSTSKGARVGHDDDNNQDSPGNSFEDEIVGSAGGGGGGGGGGAVVGSLGGTRKKARKPSRKHGPGEKELSQEIVNHMWETASRG